MKVMPLSRPALRECGIGGAGIICVACFCAAFKSAAPIMDLTEIIGLIAGICTSSALLPQLITTIRKKKAQDVSLFMFLILFVGDALWIWYGCSKKDLPVILTNIFALLLNTMMLILKIKYRKNEDRAS